MVKTCAVVKEFKHWKGKDAQVTYVLRGLIERGLSKRQAEVYDLVCRNHETGIVSKTISTKTGMRMNQVDNILGELREFGLVTRGLMEANSGYYFEWYPDV